MLEAQSVNPAPGQSVPLRQCPRKGTGLPHHHHVEEGCTRDHKVANQNGKSIGVNAGLVNVSLDKVKNGS